MARKSVILFASCAAPGTIPFIDSAESFDKAGAELFRAAPVTVQTACQTALATHSGTRAAVAFNDEGGKGVFEALVIGTAGTPWTVKVDAVSGPDRHHHPPPRAERRGSAS